MGTRRRAIAVQTAEYMFVGPDNGLLSWALANQKVKAVHSLENRTYFLPKLSSTFHGRDIFAPVAAHLSKGVPLSRFGPCQQDLIRLPWPEPTRSATQIRGEILYIDRFGNALTNITSELLSSFQGEPALFLGRKRLCPVAAAYQDVGPGRPVAVIGSTGFLEIAVNGGRAAQSLGLPIGTRVAVR